MSGRKADSRRPQTASGKGNREKTKTDKDKAIKELTRRLDREIKKIAKFEQIERETREQHQLQIVFLQEKMKTLKNKINKMQREMTKKKQLMAENGKLRILLVDAKVEIKELRQIAANECVKAESGHQRRMVTRSRSLGVRIRDVLAEFEKELKEDIYPPTDEELRATVSDILRTVNLNVTTLKELILQVEAKYSQFDLRGKRELIKSFTKTALMTNSYA